MGEVNADYKNKFSEFLNDDFNTPGALSVMQEVLKSDIALEDKLATIFDFDLVLGLDFYQAKKVEEEIPAEVCALVEQRNKAREEKNWTESDRLRAETEKMGYQIKDTDSGVEINKI